MRVPLLNPVTAVFQQLQTQATWGNAPAGQEHGYDPDFREPQTTQSAGGQPIEGSQVYGEDVKVPCQLEVKTYEEIKMLEAGDDPLTRIVLVLHRKDLANLGLIDVDTGNILLKRNDKFLRIEYRGRVVLQPLSELYISRIDQGSAGFGVDGYDLHIVYTTDRGSDPRGRG